MKFRLPFFLAVACLAFAAPVQASMHPNMAVDGLAHFMWHLQMTSQAAMTGNWPAFWAMFVDQSVCADQSWMTYIFTPAGFMLMASAVLATLLVLTKHLLQKMMRHMRFQPSALRYSR